MCNENEFGLPYETKCKSKSKLFIRKEEKLFAMKWSDFCQIVVFSFFLHWIDQFIKRNF